MPQAFAAAAAAWWAGTTTAAVATLSAAASISLATAFVYGAAYLAATVAIGAGLGALGRAVGPGLGSGSLTQGSPILMTRNPITPRRVIYGQTRVSGALVFAQVSGSKNEYLHMVVALAGHECDSIGDIYFNDTAVPLDGSGNATGTYAGLVRVKKYTGTDTQTADSDLVAESGGLWTTNHRLRGIAYIYLRLKYDTNVMPGGMPNVTAVVKGRKVFDPRDSTTVWKANVALCIRDYLTNVTFGLAFDGTTEIDDASFIAAANLCDEAVTLAAGGTEPRYAANGTFDTTADPATVLNSLTGAMSGWVVFIGGKCICGGGAHQTPSITLTESDLRAPLSVQTKMSMRDTCNRVKGTFSSPADLWQPADLPEVSNSTYLSEDGGLKIWRDLQLGFTTSASTGQRLEKIELERTRQDIVVTMPCKLTALTVQPGDVVMVNNTRFGWSSKQFLVTDLKFSVYGDQGAPALGVDLTLRETASAVWDWNFGEETIYDPAPNTNLPNPWTVAAPTGLGLTVTSFRQPEGNLVAQLQVAWTAPAEQFVQSGGLIRVQYKKHVDSNWTEAAPVKGDQVFTFILGLLIGTAYDVQIRAESNLGVASAWVQSLNFTMTSDTTAPAAVTDLSASVGTGKMVVLSWTKNTEADFAGQYNIYRGLHSGARTKIATRWANRFEDVLVTLGTNYDYDVRPVDESGNEATTSNVVSATPSVVGSGSVDTTPPSNPSAPTLSSSGARLNGDGSVVSFFVVNMPSMPSGAVGLNLYARKHSDAEWTLYNQTDTGGGTCNIDGLEPGTSYDIGLQAFSFAGYCSGIVTLNSQTAPNTSSAPSAPTGLTVDGKVPPKKVDASNYYFGLHISWTANTELDLDHYEVKVTSIDSDGSTSYSFIPQDGSDVPTMVKETSLDVYHNTLPAAYVRVRAVNRSGLASPWTNAGASQTTNANTGLNFGTASGTFAQGNDSRITGAAQKANNLSDVASSTTARQNLGVRDISVVYNATGGSPTEGFTVNHGIGTQQFKVLAEVVDPALYNDVAHDYGSGSNDANNTRLLLVGRAGGNVQAGNQRVTIHFLP